MTAADITNYVEPVSPWADWGHVAVYQLEGTPVDLTGYTARASLRSMTRDELIATFTTSNNITITAITGTVSLTVPRATTALLKGRKDVLVDLDLVHPSGTVIPLYFANLTIRSKATQILS